ncbi:MAG: divergent polysaccharide deacetylase family protein [Treponema sp.]|nr:divergent polysaccharide deacetylase family protein [Treponema sp.]
MGNTSGGKKTGTSRRSSSTTKSSAKSTAKRTTKSTTKRKSSKKPKVYIPAHKAFLLCAGVIGVCILLLITANLIQAKRNANKIEPPSITQRFEQDDKKSDDKKTETNNKDSNQQASSNQNNQSNNKRINTADKNNSTTQQNQNNKTNQATQNKNDSQNKTSTQNSTNTTNKTQQSTNEIKPNPSTEIASIKTDNKLEPQKTDNTKTTSKFNFPKAQNNAQLIFVFDDGGQNIQHLKKFLELPFPITVAVLPQITHSKESADMVRKSGNELMLHQPMQSVNAKINPGPGAITPDMSENQVISTLFTNINEIGPIEGMNNHEGSAITADADMMAVVMKLASEEGIFFLDSRTNVETKVPYVARELGYSWYERNIFLDNEKTRVNALSELNKGLALANKNGSVIMIGHIWSADFLPAFLKEAYPELKAQGYTFSTVSKSRAKKN